MSAPDDELRQHFLGRWYLRLRRNKERFPVLQEQPIRKWPVWAFVTVMSVATYRLVAALVPIPYLRHLLASYVSLLSAGSWLGIGWLIALAFGSREPEEEH